MTQGPTHVEAKLTCAGIQTTTIPLRSCHFWAALATFMATSTPTKKRRTLLSHGNKKGIHNLKDPHYLAIKLAAFSNTKHIGNGWNTRILQSRCHVDAHALETWRFPTGAGWNDKTATTVFAQIIFIGKAHGFFPHLCEVFFHKLGYWKKTHIDVDMIGNNDVFFSPIYGYWWYWGLEMISNKMKIA